MIFLELTAYRCPLPLVNIKLALKRMQAGEQLRVTLSDSGSRQDVPAFLKNQGHGLAELSSNEHCLELLITKAGSNTLKKIE
jgi:tRNA 2-thiouridine synthesizing protein A